MSVPEGEDQETCALQGRTASTFHRLLAPFEDLQPGEERQERVCAEGRVVVKRLLGRRLAFFDLQSLAPGEDAVLQLRFILPAWQGPAPDGDHVAEEREKERERSFWWTTKNVKPGDVVEAEGFPERTTAGTLSITVTNLRLVKQWVETATAASGSDACCPANKRGKHFTPRRRSPDESKNPTYVSRHSAIVPERAVSADGSAIPPLCKFWWKGKCEHGERCKYRHAFVSEAERERIEEHRREKAEIRQKEHDPSDPFEDKLPRSARAKIFREWLVKTFGAERLREGSGVVDVAGGKGYLSFQLQCTGHDIPTTLIEPRLAKLNKKQKKQLKKQKKPAFRQICTWFEPGLWTPTDEGNGGGEETAAASPQQPATVAEVERLAPAAARAILRDCSAVVGLHSDQATEPIVDFALAHNKCFAVVPCCVFPEQFPDRRTKDGRLVVVTDDFIRYLMERDPRIQLAYLEMEGRNKVVYMLP